MQMDVFLLETTDENHNRLVMFHVNDILRQKREILHGRVRMILEEAPAAGAETRVLTSVNGETVTALTSRAFRYVRGSFAAGYFSAVGVREYFGRGMFSAQKGHNWSMMAKDFPLR